MKAGHGRRRGSCWTEAQEPQGGGADRWASGETGRQGGLRNSGSLHQALWRQSQVWCSSLWLTHPEV